MSSLAVFRRWLLPAFLLLAGSAGHAATAEGSSAARGAYLATAGNCKTCHTRPGGKDYEGGLSFVTDFGTLYSTNITADRKAGIGNWTYAEFARAISPAF